MIDRDRLTPQLFSALGSLAVGIVYSPMPGAVSSNPRTLHTRPDGIVGVDWLSAPSQALIDAADSIIQAHDGTPLTLRQLAVALADAVEVPQVVLRAVLLAVLDEVNALRQRDVDRAADVAAATSLADLKTRWAARAALAQRTAAGAKQTVKDRINDGSAD